MFPIRRKPLDGLPEDVRRGILLLPADGWLGLAHELGRRFAVVDLQHPMAETPQSDAEILLYQTEDGRIRIDVRFEGETAWLTQASIARLYQTTPQNITMHIAAVYQEGELSEAATCKEHLLVRQEGARQVRRSLKHYSLPSRR
jgi:hypothetical protein